MGVYVGSIASIEEPPTRARAILRVTLGDGRRVYAPRQLLDQALLRNGPGAEYVFVERGVLGRTHWVGTWDEVRWAVREGTLSVQEGMAAGWDPWLGGDDARATGINRVQIVKPPNRSLRVALAAIVRTSNEMPDRGGPKFYEAALVADRWLREPFAAFEVAESQYRDLRQTMEFCLMPSPLVRPFA